MDDFEEQVLTRIFGAKMEEAAEARRKFLSEEVLALYCSLNIVRTSK
jgi:hypothetical protein